MLELLLISYLNISCGVIESLRMMKKLHRPLTPPTRSKIIACIGTNDYPNSISVAMHDTKHWPNITVVTTVKKGLIA